MQRGDVSCAKQARVLSGNEIRKIVMDSDSDEDKYYASEAKEEEEEPRPPLRQYSISQPPSLDYSASSSEDEADVGSMAGQQPQFSVDTTP
jgi:hypothetical protein